MIYEVWYGDVALGEFEAADEESAFDAALAGLGYASRDEHALAVGVDASVLREAAIVRPCAAERRHAYLLQIANGLTSTEPLVVPCDAAWSDDDSCSTEDIT